MGKTQLPIGFIGKRTISNRPKQILEKADKSNLNLYNRNLQQYANENRKSMTKAAACMWKFVLRARRMKGYQFRRERPILNFIADFACLDLKLVIEVDGRTHYSKEAQEKDKRRDEILSSAGFTTLRFDNSRVLNEIAEVKADIENWIDKNANIPPPGPRVRNRRKKSFDGD